MSGSFSRAVVFCFFFSAVWTSPNNCWFGSPLDGCMYDFSSMILSGPPYYTFTNEWTYELNICEPIINGCGGGAGVCQYTNTMGYNLGDASTNFTDLPSHTYQDYCQGVRLTYSDGVWCEAYNLARETHIDIYCDPEAEEPYIANVNGTNGRACDYHVTMYAREACGSPPFPSASASPSGSVSPRYSASTSASMSKSPAASASTSPSMSYSPSPMASSSAMSGNSPACAAFPIKGLREGSNLTLFGSTSHAPSYSDDCQPPGWTTWYSLTSSGTITISTCNAYTNFRTALYLRQGSCQSMQCTAFGQYSCSSRGSTIRFNANPAETYYLSVTGVDGAYGDYQLVLSLVDNSDPACSHAISLPGPYFTPLRIAGSNQDAWESKTNMCGVYPGGRTVWYHIAPTPGSPMLISTCSVNTDFDTVVSVLAGSCSAFHCVRYNDNNCTTTNGYGLASTLTFLPNSDSYYLAISGKQGSTGYYNLYLQQQAPAGFSCETSEQLVFLTPGVYTETGNTTLSGNLQSSVCQGESGRAYWYHASAPVGATIEITTCSAYTAFKAALSVCSGTCGNLHCVTYSDSTCPNSAKFSGDVASNFYIVVSGSDSQVGVFHMTITVE